MNKLERIRASLRENNSVLVAKVIENSYPPEDVSFIESVDFWVCPRKPLFNVKKLQSFMMTLVPSELDITCKDDFYRPDYRWDLELGKLYFDEILTGEQKRRIGVRLFPSKRIIDAIDSRDIFSQFRIEPAELLKYGRGCGLVEYIRNLLGTIVQKHREANEDKNIYFLSGGGY